MKLLTILFNIFVGDIHVDLAPILNVGYYPRLLLDFIT